MLRIGEVMSHQSCGSHFLTYSVQNSCANSTWWRQQK